MPRTGTADRPTTRNRGCTKPGTVQPDPDRWQGGRVGEDEEGAVHAVNAALASSDQATLRLLLHPYLHWTDADGVTTRGRTKVLALLDDRGASPTPQSFVELRDGQIYRWRSG